MKHQTTGRIECQGAAALAALRKRAAEWEVPLDEIPCGLCFRVWDSVARLEQRDGEVLIDLEAPEERLLQTLQSSLAELFGEHGLTAQWDNVREGALAPGLALMTVESVERLSPGFTRVTLRGPEAARFAQGGLHFRLLLPPKARPPVWPRICASGRTIWPDGDDALHRPVYTTVMQGGDWLAFDIFRHTGSPTTNWADRMPLGETVGILGPGGGMCPEGSPLVLLGDQTALPAIRRMLDLATGEVTARVFCAAEDMAELVNDTRVTRSNDLLADLETLTLPPAGAHIWFAGSAEAARQARRILSARGLGKRDFTAAAYWSPIKG